MKASVIGMGSMGKRHYENLKKLGVEVRGYDLNDTPDYSADFVVISTHDHMPYIQDCLHYGIPFFVEKPVVSSIDDLNLIKYSFKPYDVPNMVACNLRFSETLNYISHDDIISIHARVSDSNPSRAKYEHPIWIQDIHEFDLMNHLIGSIEQVSIYTDNDSYDAVIKHENGRISTIHGDKLSGQYHRSITVETKYTTAQYLMNVSESMYFKQMDYFIQCLKNNVVPMNPLEEALDVTERILNGNYYSSKTHLDKISR